MALDFLAAHHTFIKKKSTLATALSLLSYQHLLTHCKYSSRAFVTPSVHPPDKLWWQSNNLCITLGPEQTALTGQEHTPPSLPGLSTATGAPSPPSGNSWRAAIPAFWPGRCTIALYWQMQTHTFLEWDFPGDTKAKGAAILCKEPSLGLATVTFSRWPHHHVALTLLCLQLLQH